MMSHSGPSIPWPTPQEGCPTYLPACYSLDVIQFLPWGPGAHYMPGKHIHKNMLEALVLYALETPSESRCVFEADCVNVCV